jgi:uncharacterized protein (DUF169 family)
LGHTDYPLIGIKFFKQDEKPDLSEAEKKGCISFCQAVKTASEGGPVFIGPGSISVCKWSPPSLGLKVPESDFEKSMEPKLPFLASGILISRLDKWPEEVPEPDTVLFRGDKDYMLKIIKAADEEEMFIDSSCLGQTAVPVLMENESHLVKSKMVSVTNTLLDFLGRYDWWTRTTIWAFKHEWPSEILDYVLDRTMANMSMCRNSTVIPYISQKVNISHFCTGGISWGKNPAQYMTGGMPYKTYLKLKPLI